MKNLRILVVDDEELQRDALAQILRDQKYQVVTSSNSLDAQSKLSEMNFDVILTDFRMPGESGLELARMASQSYPESAVFIMTAHAEVSNVIDSMRVGVVDYLLKPVNVDALLRKLELLQERRDLRGEVSYLRTALETRLPRNRLLGDSNAMKEIRKLLEEIAPTKSSVLIMGESGTGKEVAARSIHELSPQGKKKFVAINCGAIPESLLESELFGHKKGSFTGAIADKEGLFVTADGGTLFLDELGELPKSLQVKLLRVLQTRELTPVGSTEVIKIDVRLIGATNRDLQKDVEAGLFRQDLYYRVNVVEIKMPALRERKEDIPLLAQSALARLAPEMGRKIRGFSNEALRKFMAYSWPGNVRELENVIERALIVTRESDLIEVSNLPAGFQNLNDEHSHELDGYLKACAREHIAKVLDAFGGDKKEAAKAMGLSLSSLYRKMEELEITTSDGPTRA